MRRDVGKPQHSPIKVQARTKIEQRSKTGENKIN